MSTWVIVGIVSLTWSGFELLSGEAWLHRAVRRDQEPIFYWLVVLLWAALGCWCLAPQLLFYS